MTDFALGMGSEQVGGSSSSTADPNRFKQDKYIVQVINRGFRALQPKHFIKDMKIAIGSAENMGLDLPGLQLAKQLYEKLADRGCEDDGTQALFKLYQDQL